MTSFITFDNIKFQVHKSSKYIQRKSKNNLTTAHDTYCNKTHSPERWSQAQAMHSYNHHHNHHHHVVMVAAAVEMVISGAWTMNKWERHRSGHGLMQSNVLTCASKDKRKQQNIPGYCSPFKIRTKTHCEHKSEMLYEHLIYGVACP